MKKFIYIFSAIVFFSLLFFAFKLNRFYKKIYTPEKNNQTNIKPEKEKRIFNILLLGYGGQGHDGAYLTDTIILVRMDTKKKKVALISIPRDLAVKVPTKKGGGFYSKINAVYQMGFFPRKYPNLPDQFKGEKNSPRLIKLIISKITGFPVDNYLALDFAGFKKGVDILGGVDVYVDKAFDDYQYPIAGRENDLCGREEKELPQLEKLATESPQLAFPCRYEHLHFNQGLTHMDGETALKYVRSRHSLQDGGDFGRAKRQQRFLEAVKDKVLSISFIPKIIPLLDQMENHLKTDIPVSRIKQILNQAKYADQYQIIRIVLSTDNVLTSSHSSYNGYILIPKKGRDHWKEVKSFIKSQINKNPPQ